MLQSKISSHYFHFHTCELICSITYNSNLCHCLFSANWITLIWISATCYFNYLISRICMKSKYAYILRLKWMQNFQSITNASFANHNIKIWLLKTGKNRSKKTYKLLLKSINVVIRNIFMCAEFCTTRELHNLSDDINISRP